MNSKNVGRKYVISIVGSDNKILIWNVATEEVKTEIDFPDIPLSASWNWDGGKLVATCKDKKIRLIDPRTGSINKVICFLPKLFCCVVFVFFLSFCKPDSVLYKTVLRSV